MNEHAMNYKQTSTFFLSGKHDEKGREFVIAIGYTMGGRFGYFIAMRNPDYTLAEALSFTPRIDNTSYQTIMSSLESHIAAADKSVV